MLESIKKNRVFFLFIAAILLLSAHLFLFNFSDFLGFDAIGYTLRYKLAFSGWNNSMMLGFPASFFDQPFPSILPMFFDFIGLGHYTLPYILSLLVLRILLMLSFLLLPFKNTKMKLLFGIFFALNPFTFNFFYRIYELAGWVFFVPAVGFIYSFLNEKKFGLNFLLAVAFTAACALSSSAPLFFLVIGSFLLLTSFDDLKHLVAYWISTGLLVSFWFLPYFFYLDYSYVRLQQGMELQTLGIFASGVFLLFVMAYAFLKFSSSLGWKEKLREKNLLLGSIILALIILAAPRLPLINKPFAHSYHAFFIFAISFAVISFGGIRTLLPSFNSFRKKAIAAALVLLLVLGIAFFLPKTISQYTRNYPVIFDSFSVSSDSTKVSFTKAINEINKLPPDLRFLELPYSPLIESWVVLNNNQKNLQTAMGWGYDPYVRENAFNFGMQINSMKLSCDEFIEKSNILGITNFVSLTKEAKAYLDSCGIQSQGNSLPSTHSSEKLSGIIGNGKIIESGNGKISLEINPPFTILKMNYFPKWNIYPAKEFQDMNPGIKIFTEKKELIELRYENTLIESLGCALSAIGIILLVSILIYNKNFLKKN